MKIQYHLFFVLLLFVAIFSFPWNQEEEKRQQYRRYIIEGINASEIRDWPKAEVKFNEAIKLDPTNAEAYLERGKYKKMGKGRYQNNYDHKGALEDFNKAIELDSNYKEAYLLRAWIKETWVPDYSGALEDYAKAILLDPNDAEIYVALGDHKYLRENNYSGATDYYTKALEIDPNEGNYYTKRSYMWIKLKEKDKFCIDYLMAMRLGDHEVQESLKYLEYASWAKECN